MRTDRATSGGSFRSTSRRDPGSRSRVRAVRRRSRRSVPVDAGGSSRRRAAPNDCRSSFGERYFERSDALRSTLLRGGTLVVASTFVWHASNFGFNAAAAHLLGPVKYGNLTSAVAL